jgi:hypothetical protein
MNVLVDTSIWSNALRRRRVHQNEETRELSELIAEGRVVMIGPIRQELLSGLREPQQFQRLQAQLRAFRDVALTEEDFEDAAECFNRCRVVGVQGSNTDFLVCATSRRRGWAVFTTDNDFARFAEILGIQLHSPRTVPRGTLDGGV